MNITKAILFVIGSLALGLVGWMIGSAFQFETEIGLAAFLIPSLCLIVDIHDKRSK